MTDLISRTAPKADEHISDKVLTAANAITVCRLALIPISLAFLLQDRNIEAAILFGIAASTDFLDGMVARKTNSVTRLGQFLDPLVDRVLIFSAVIGLLIMGRIPVWMVAIVVLRDVYLVVGGIYLARSRHAHVAVSYIGKVSMWGLCIGFGGLILNLPLVEGLGWVNATWLPGFCAGLYCPFIWFAYIGVFLSVLVAVIYTMQGVKALSLPKVEEGER